MSTREILGQAKTVRQLLGVKYAVDYYQREYKWEQKQIRELIEDLTGEFLENYQPEQPRIAVKDYNPYFLGSIILSERDGTTFIVDGQQRLTSLTLLLVYLRNLQRGRPDQVNVDDLIYSELFGEKSFNLDVPERLPAMRALFEEQPIDPEGQAASVRAIVARYHDISDLFPDEIRDDALPYFIDWLTQRVNLVEITAFSDEEAYTIFETMNDRGLSLTSAEMLKGFLLTNIDDEDKRALANDRWRGRTQALAVTGKETEADFFKAWLRSQYAEKIRERKKRAQPEDFDLIGTEFHRWVRHHATEKDGDRLTLRTSDDYFRFITRDFDFFSRNYLRLMDAAQTLTPGLEHVFYLARTPFTHQYMVMLAPLRSDDGDEIARRKMRLVAQFLDIWLAWRIWNNRSITYSSTQYSMFLLMRSVRGLDPDDLARRLHAELLKDKETETFDSNDRFTMHQQNRWMVHLLLARLTDFLETASGMPSRYLEYVNEVPKHRYEVEHIWADKPELHADEFAHPFDFHDYRNRVGDLLLLPKSSNASFGAIPYDQKAKYYEGQNLLARSLTPAAYDHNPGFLQFIKQSGLPFHAHAHFRKADLDERQALYRELAKRVWNPVALLQEALVGALA